MTAVLHDTLRIRENEKWIRRAMDLMPTVGTWGLPKALMAEGCDWQFTEKLVRLLDPEFPGT
jgi:hypothetical protein